MDVQSFHITILTNINLNIGAYPKIYPAFWQTHENARIPKSLYVTFSSKCEFTTWMMHIPIWDAKTLKIYWFSTLWAINKEERTVLEWTGEKSTDVCTDTMM
jgi:hypothetical protein